MVDLRWIEAKRRLQALNPGKFISYGRYKGEIVVTIDRVVQEGKYKSVFEAYNAIAIKHQEARNKEASDGSSY